MGKRTLISYGATLVLLSCGWLFGRNAGRSLTLRHSREARHNSIPINSTSFKDLAVDSTWFRVEGSRGVFGWTPLSAFERPEIQKGETRIRGAVSEPYRSPLALQATNETLQAFLEKKGYRRIKLHPLASGYLSATCKIDGKRANFLIDTGTPSTRLDPHRAEWLGIKLIKHEHLSVAKNFGASLTHSVVSTLELGGLRIDELKIWSYDLSAINSGVEGIGEAPFDGMIGADVLAPLQAIIDYKDYYIYIFPIERPRNGDAPRIRDRPS